MKISGIAVGQWNANVRKKEGKHRTKYKIRRAIVLGNVSHVYDSNDYVVRYHDMNLLVSHTGIVMMVWKDNSRPVHFVSEEIKTEYDEVMSHKQNIKNSCKKHWKNVKSNKTFYDKKENNDMGELENGQESNRKVS